MAHRALYASGGYLVLLTLNIPTRGGSRIWQWGGGGGKIYSEASYTYERSELRVKRV